MGSISTVRLAATLLFVILYAARSADAQRLVFSATPRRALLIGNSTYQRLPRLRSPRANVDALAAALRNAKFQPQVAYDLSQAEMISVVRGFTATVQPGDFVLVYFSGYSYQADDLNYLLPVGFDPKDDSPPGQRALSVRFLDAQVDPRQPGTKMFLLDASRSCPDLPEGLAMMIPSQNTLVAFSAAPNQSVAEPAGGGISAFTAALIRAIEEPGSKPASVLMQVPFYTGAPVGDFYFTNPLPPKPAIEPVLPPPTLPPSDELKPGRNRENRKDLLTYAWIPPGTFKMGCPPSDAQCMPDEKPQHEVKITKGFWTTRTEVTTGAYQRFTSATGHREPGKTQTNPKLAGTDLPVTKVTWDDAKAYCEWAGGRLPTEAEWEYAARGGKAELKFPWGNTFDPKLANSFKTDPKLKRPFIETVPVRKLGSGNGFDLFDMLGNAREWTADFYSAAYSSAGPLTDPAGPKEGKDRVVRGGSFFESEKSLRLSARDHADPAKQDNETGFRCVLPSLTANN
jgi:formylglycine-generating enzyme required for sulfatase activity